MDPRVLHGPFIGWANPRCERCERNQMWIQRHPTAACERQAARLPFEEIRPVPVKVAMTVTKKRANG